MFGKLALGAIAEKAFEKAGGVDGIVKKGKTFANNAKTRGQQIQQAIKNKSIEDGASIIGSVAKDIVDTAKEAGQATVEIGQDTAEDAANAYEKAKQIWADLRNNDTNTATATTNKEQDAIDVATMVDAIKDADIQGAYLVEAYYAEGNTLSATDAKTLSDALQATTFPKGIKEALQTMITENVTQDAAPVQKQAPKTNNGMGK